MRVIMLSSIRQHFCRSLLICLVMTIRLAQMLSHTFAEVCHFNGSQILTTCTYIRTCTRTPNLLSAEHMLGHSSLVTTDSTWQTVLF